MANKLQNHWCPICDGSDLFDQLWFYCSWNVFRNKNDDYLRRDSLTANWPPNPRMTKPRKAQFSKNQAHSMSVERMIDFDVKFLFTLVDLQISSRSNSKPVRNTSRDQVSTMIGHKPLPSPHWFHLDSNQFLASYLFFDVYSEQIRNHATF